MRAEPLAPRTGSFFSHRLLLALVESGLERDEAYRLVQRNAMRAWDEERDFARARPRRRRDRRAPRRGRARRRLRPRRDRRQPRQRRSTVSAVSPRRRSPSMSEAAARRQRQGPRALRARRRAPAARRERPHLDVRRRPADRDPRQGSRAHRALRLLVRADDASSSRTICSRCATTGARPSAGGSRCCRSSASSAATSPAPAGRTTSRPARSAGTACRRASIESEQLPRADLHAGDEGADRATTRTSTAPPRSSSSARSASTRSSGSRSSSTASSPSYARDRGIILADTKLEFGLDEDGRLVLGDEAFTPDSSRFWPADEYAPGRRAAVVRQAVRARLLRVARLGQDRTPARSCPTTSSPARAPATSRRSSA